MKDGLKSEEFNVTTLSGGTVLADTATLGASEVGAAEIAGGAVTSAKILSGNVLTVHISGGQVTTAKLASDAVDASVHNLIGTGSPTVFGYSVQAGSVVATDVAVWTVFGTAFAAAPLVVIGNAVSGAAATQPGMVTTSQAGSFGMLGTSGLAYHWFAIGSGAL